VLKVPEEIQELKGKVEVQVPKDFKVLKELLEEQVEQVLLDHHRIQE
jgi:hypothetical protein